MRFFLLKRKKEEKKKRKSSFQKINFTHLVGNASNHLIFFFFEGVSFLRTMSSLRFYPSVIETSLKRLFMDEDRIKKGSCQFSKHLFLSFFLSFAKDFLINLVEGY